MKKLEKVIKILKDFKEQSTSAVDVDSLLINKSIETVLNHIDNSISKEVIEEKIKELENSQVKVKNNNLIYSREDVFRFQIYILEELLEGK